MAVVAQNVLGLSLGKVPMAKILLPYMWGILLGHYFVVSALNLVFVGITLFILTLSIVLLNFYHEQPNWTNGGTALLIHLFLVMLGYWSSVKTDPTVQRNYFGSVNAEQYVGEVVDEPIVRKQNVRFPVKIKSAQRGDSSFSVQGTLMVTVSRKDSTPVSLKYGDVIAFKNSVTEVPPPYNPGEFDYKAYLINKNVWHQCYLFADQYKLLSSHAGNPLILRSLRIRKLLIDKFEGYLQNDQAFQVAAALIFGYRSQIDTATLHAFTDTGTIHVLSVSGLHVGLVFGFLNLLLGWLDQFRYGKMIRCFLILSSVWSYVVLTGMAPPILRAGIMISFFLLSILVGRRQVALNTLAASAFFILLFVPESLFDVGFQLSYLAMLGILLLYPIMRSLYLPQNKYLSWMVEYSYVSISAQLFTLPLVLHYFGQFPTYFLFANLFIALPSTGIMYIGLVLAICPFPVVNTYLGKILDCLLVFFLEGLEWMANLPLAVIRGIDWPVLLVIIGLVFVMGLTISLNHKNKVAVYISALMAVIAVSTTCYQFITKANYSGLKIYNVRSEFALAYLEKGGVVLFSSYDSINHPRLVFSVLPDLTHYVDRNKIEFVHVQSDKQHNAIIQVGDKSIVLLEDRWSMSSRDSVDFIIWRKNNKTSLDGVKKYLKTAGKVVFDGSNTDKYTTKFVKDLDRNASRIYWLKDNFAYVWNRY